MKFVDEAKIIVKAGNGGPGAKSFRREKFVPLGGPDGGNGGSGGSVTLVVDQGKSTLLDFHFRPIWEADSGDKGDGSRKDGLWGDDLIILVPQGTQVFKYDNDELGNLVCDLVESDAKFVLAKGGRGGKGNAFFKTSTNRAPEHFQPGEEGENGNYLLSLKLVADVGLVGFPNAGKSTLISRISSATPKIADYPFTTLTPNLGVVRAPGIDGFVVADVPGLIPGASVGKGLGIQFLKHIERTRVIAHLIDPNQLDENGEPQRILETYKIIRTELEAFSEELTHKEEVIVITKSDTIDEETLLSIKKDLASLDKQYFIISAVVGSGLEELLRYLSQKLRVL